MAKRRKSKSPINLSIPRSSSEEYKYDPAKQVEGLKERFEGAGLDSEQVADTRGPVKKALNLKADQNILFDYFELMKRPQQALFGGIHAAQQDEDFFSGMLEGIKGNKETKFKNILHELGVEETEGKLGFDDIAGMAGDIFLDPMKLAVIPGGWAGAGKDVQEAMGVLKEVQGIVDSSQSAIDASKIAVETAAEVVEATGKTLTEAQKALEIAKQLKDNQTLDAITLAKTTFGDDYANILSNIYADSNLLDDLQNIQQYKDISNFEQAVKTSRGALKTAEKTLKGAQQTQFNQAVQLGAATDRLNKAKSTIEIAEAQSKKFIPASQFITKKIGSGVRGTFSIVDSGLTKLLRWLDEPKRALNIKLGKSIVDDFGNSKIGTLEEMYKAIKDTVEGTFNYFKKLPAGLNSKIAKLKGGKSFAEYSGYTLYDQRYQELQTLSNTIAENYNKLSKINNWGHTITSAEAERAILAMYENGHNLFDSDISFGFDFDTNKKVSDLTQKGVVNVTLSGMNKQVNLNEILLADRYLQDMGLTKENAELFESYIRTIFPEWYDANITNGTRTLFRDYKDAHGVVKDSFRIYDQEMHTELREMFEKLNNADLATLPAERVTDIIRLQTLNNPEAYKEMMGQYDSMVSVEKELSELNSYLNDLAKTKGTPKVIPKEVFREQGLVKYKKLLDSYDDTLKKYNEVIDTTLEEFNTLTKADPKYNEIYNTLLNIYDDKFDFEQQVVDAKKILEKALEDFGVSKNDLHNQLTVKKQELEGVLNEFKTALGVGPSNIQRSGKSILELGATKFNIGNHFTDNHIEFMKRLYDVEGTDQMLASIHLLHHQAADYITQYIGKGLEIDDYYISHVITDDWVKFKSGKLVGDGASNIDQGVFKLAGNSAAFQSRRYQTSIHEANRLAESKLKWLMDTGAIKEEVYQQQQELFDKGLKMFSEDLTTSFLDFVTKGSKAAADAHIYKAVMEATLLPSKQLLEAAGENKTDFVRITNDGTHAMRGFNKYKGSDFINKARGLAMYLPKEERNEFVQALTSELRPHGNSDVWIAKELDRLIGRVVVDSPDKKHLLAAFDMFNRVFKRNKLLTPGFQFRNIVGSMSNMWLGGMSPKDIMGGMYDSHRLISRANKLQDMMQRGLEIKDPKDVQLLLDWQEFQANGFATAGNKIHDIPKEILHPHAVANKGSFKQYLDASKAAGGNFRAPTAREVAGAPLHAYNSLVNFNLGMNMQLDAINRFTVWRFAKDPNNSHWLMQNGYTTPEEAVRTMLFDYTDLSAAEQDIMKRIIPFYTFTKKNIAFQIQNMAKNTNKYIALRDMNDALWTGFIDDEKELDRYKYENFWIPIPIQKDGKYKAIKASLPLGGFGEFISSPIKHSVASMAPPIRAPFELATNTQVFSGMPISQYDGQKGYYIPEISKKAEYGLSQFGLDVPAMGVADPIRAFAGLGKEDGPRNVGDFLTQGFGRSMVGEGDTAKTAERKAYNQLDHLQNQLRYYRERNIDIPTLAEINNRNKFASSNRILGRLRSYRKK